MSRTFVPVPGILARGRGHEGEYARRSRGLVGETLHLYAGAVLVISLIYWLAPAKLNRRSQKSASNDWSEVLVNVVPRCVVPIHSSLLSTGTLRGLAAMTDVIVAVIGGLSSRHYESMLIILRLVPLYGWRRRRWRERLSAWKCVVLEVMSGQVSRTL